MKLIFSSIFRLILSYSKFLASLVILSSLGTNVSASTSGQTYLKCNDNYYRLNGYYFSSNYNVRTKKFQNDWKITDYTANYIRIEYGAKINRNTGEYKSSQGRLICFLEVINPKDLPKLNDKGKLF